MIWNKCEHVLLPTTKSRLYNVDGVLDYICDDGSLIANDPPRWSTYHLYVFVNGRVNGRVKRDEFCYDGNGGITKSVCEIYGNKIIASTDPNLPLLQISDVLVNDFTHVMNLELNIQMYYKTDPFEIKIFDADVFDNNKNMIQNFLNKHQLHRGCQIMPYEIDDFLTQYMKQ